MTDHQEAATPPTGHLTHTIRLACTVLLLAVHLEVVRANDSNAEREEKVVAPAG